MGTPRVSYGLAITRRRSPGRPQHLVAQPVALLEHLQDGPLLGTLPRLGQQGLVDVRVERASVPISERPCRSTRPSSERWTGLTPSSSLASSCSAAASSARSRSSSTGSSSFRSRSFARLVKLDLLARDALAVVVEVGGEAEIGLVRSRGGLLRRRLLDDLLALLDPGLEWLVGHWSSPLPRRSPRSRRPRRPRPRRASRCRPSRRPAPARLGVEHLASFRTPR